MNATSKAGEVAQAFLDARAKKTPLTAYPGVSPVTMEEAYRIQDCALALDPRRVGGWKVGRIPDALVAQYGANRLTGPIFVDEIIDASRGEVPAMPVYADGFAAAEAEVLLCLGDIGSGEHDLASVRGAIVDVRAGIEIASSPFTGINGHGPAVTASDYGNNKGLVLGPAIEGWQDLDLVRMPVEVHVDGVRAGSATMETMLDGPFGSVLFLIRTLRSRGIEPAPGTWVSAGAITGIHEVRPGQVVEALFDGKFRVGCTISS